MSEWLIGYLVGLAVAFFIMTLHQAGYIEYGKGTVNLTDDGRARANYPSVEPTNEALHAEVLSKLSGPEQRILQPLLDMYPGSMSNDELAAAAGYSMKGGAYNNPRSRLRTLGLIEYLSGGHVLARSILFPQDPNGD